MNSRAAPPIDAPAMPPGLSFAVVDEVVEVVEELEVDEVVVDDGILEAAELTTTPLGVRSW
jgi:hypothetical protein